MRVADKTAVSLLRMIFGRLQQEEFLFVGSHHQYRKKRWDLLVSDFGICKDSGLAPGDLRGGSAVFHYISCR